MRENKEQTVGATHEILEPFLAKEEVDGISGVIFTPV
jgi:hypothetical protein